MADATVERTILASNNLREVSIIQDSASGTDNDADDTSDPGDTVLAPTEVRGVDKFGLQFIEVNNNACTVKVWGSLVEEPGSTIGTNWNQIGDDISVTANGNAYKAISTTPLKWIAVTAKVSSGTSRVKSYILGQES